MNRKSSLADLSGNVILGHLPIQEQKQLQTHLEVVSVEVRQELDEVGGDLRYICFPLTVPSALWPISRLARAWKSP